MRKLSRKKRSTALPPQWVIAFRPPMTPTHNLSKRGRRRPNAPPLCLAGATWVLGKVALCKQPAKTSSKTPSRRLRLPKRRVGQAWARWINTKRPPLLPQRPRPWPLAHGSSASSCRAQIIPWWKLRLAWIPLNGGGHALPTPKPNRPP